MSLFGVTKGTELEKQVEQYLKAESQGVVMYCGLARLARERGLHDIAEALLKLASDEARHAGLYAVLNGAIPEDLFTVLGNFAKLEMAALEPINALAEKARLLGLHEVAREIEAAGQDEWHHGKVLEELIQKHTGA